MRLRSLLPAIALAVLLAACTKHDTDSQAPMKEPATITVTIPDEGLTKVSMATEPGNPDGPVKLAWEAGDVITVKNARVESRSVAFTLVSGENTKTAVFAADDVSKLNGAAKFNIYLDGRQPDDYNAQTQASDGSIAHLGYSASLLGVNNYTSFTFSQAWALANGGGAYSSAAVLRLRAQMPDAAIADAVRKVTLKASANIFNGSDELSVAIASPGVEGDGKIVTVYAQLPAADVDVPGGTELFVRFQVSDNPGDTYTAYRELPSMKMSAGKVNTMKLDCSRITVSAGAADDGSSSNPYIIADRNQLLAMHDLLVADATRYFRVVADIDLEGTSWEPLNLSPYTKKMDFDGGGHTISNLSSDGTAFDYPSFAGVLYGSLRNVIFDGAVINCDSKKGGVMAGYIGTGSYAGNCSGVKVLNATVTSGTYVGGLAAQVGFAGTITDCHVVSSSITTTGGRPAGLIGEIDKACTLSDCSAEDVAVEGSGHYAGGLVAYMKGGTVRRCHTTGSVTITGTGRHVGGLIGCVDSGSSVEISNCWSSCTVHGRGFVGGLAGTLQNNTVNVSHCFASGDVTTGAIAGAGGLIGQVASSTVTVTDCIAWNGNVTPQAYELGNYSSGAVVGRTHPNCVLTDNYRNPAMNLTAYWVPGVAFDHPNVNGTTAPLVRIGTDLDEEKAAATSLTEFDTDHGRWAYHGKHCGTDATFAPDNAFGWVGDAGSGSTGSTVTVKLREGVVWTQIHDVWEGQIRFINIVKTELSDANRFEMTFDYGNGETIRDKCDKVGALVGTNGPMACCQFVRINGKVEHAATDVEYPFIANCALTFDNNVPDIVRTADNYAAAALPNSNVACAGPLLVYNGEIQTYNTNEDFLTDTHPRTAIGITEDCKTLVQVTVDGRWSGRAVGMPISVLATLMKSLGCYKAMNLDGGGGTVMWIYGYGVDGVVNHPTDSPKSWDNPTVRPTGTAMYIKR